MAFGTGSRSFGPNAVIYSFKIKTKDLPAPLFEVSKKVGDEYKPVLDDKGKQVTATRVSGNITSAVPKENVHDGKTIRSINLTIQGNGADDKDDVYFVSVGETFLGRNLYNSLLGLKSYEDIEIGLYQSRPKAGQTKTFASVSLRQYNEPVRGPYDQKKDMPAVKKVRVNGKDQSDTEELDNWFREKMKAWCKQVNAAAKGSAPVAAPAQAGEEGAHVSAPTDETSSTEDEDQVPF